MVALKIEPVYPTSRTYARLCSGRQVCGFGACPRQAVGYPIKKTNLESDQRSDKHLTVHTRTLHGFISIEFGASISEAMQILNFGLEKLVSKSISLLRILSCPFISRWVRYFLSPCKTVDLQ